MRQWRASEREGGTDLEGLNPVFFLSFFDSSCSAPVCVRTAHVTQQAKDSLYGVIYNIYVTWVRT